MILSLLLLTAALLIVTPSSRRRFRRVMGLIPLRPPRPPRPRKVDSLHLAATWDLLAACLRAGLPVPTAVSAVSDDLPVLRGVAEQLALGADPRQAWAAALECPHTKGLARAARRTALSGAGLAEVAGRLAEEVRGQVEHQAEARAQRATVLITLPLGLCFLPAFLCLGVLPVVLGLVARTFAL
ncbi:pilus assembly protein TadC [Actinokineospora baliensis]|uniref:type II secretion system F family protein n=1 Tax=Actinokineospora baliensis TaxID=547056 RepID=UPI00195DDD75|nr:type II secretion system F family protein [Actinokineospora baliensis]MBM7771402.1 pilus assembly protein TadC [Actinokineospora baliensis]